MLLPPHWDVSVTRGRDGNVNAHMSVRRVTLRRRALALVVRASGKRKRAVRQTLTNRSYESNAMDLRM